MGDRESDRCPSCLAANVRVLVGLRALHRIRICGDLRAMKRPHNDHEREKQAIVPLKAFSRTTTAKPAPIPTLAVASPSPCSRPSQFRNQSAPSQAPLAWNVNTSIWVASGCFVTTVGGPMTISTSARVIFVPTRESRSITGSGRSCRSQERRQRQEDHEHGQMMPFGACEFHEASLAGRDQQCKPWIIHGTAIIVTGKCAHEFRHGLDPATERRPGPQAAAITCNRRFCRWRREGARQQTRVPPSRC
jgi:hypothetical protein